ncbi:hypothetical protein DPEC_G00323330, partial [Dallia pectoralis]
MCITLMWCNILCSMCITLMWCNILCSMCITLMWCNILCSMCITLMWCNILCSMCITLMWCISGVIISKQNINPIIFKFEYFHPFCLLNTTLHFFL